jgi:hypothetical protein
MFDTAGKALREPRKRQDLFSGMTMAVNGISLVALKTYSAPRTVGFLDIAD